MIRYLKPHPRPTLGLFLSALILRLLAIGHPIEVDSFHWLREGADFLRGLGAGDLPATYGGAHPGVISMWLIGLGLALEYLGLRLLGQTDQALLPWLEALLAAPYPGLSHYVWARLILAPITAGLMVAVYRLGARAFNRRIAMLATALLLFEPYYLAHARVLVPDALAASFVLLSLLAMLAHLRDGRARTLLAAGLWLGLAVMSKLPTIVAGPLMIIWLLARELTSPKSERRGPKGILRTSLLLTSSALLTAWAVWPALWDAPGLTLARWWSDLFGRELGARLSFFLGRRTFDPGPLFYPVVLLFRASPVTILGVVAAIAIGVTGRRRARFGQPLLALASFPIALMVVLSLDATKIDRYLLPALPPLTFIAAWGWLALSDRLVTYLGHRARRLPPTLILTQAALALAFFPDYFSYYNPLMGGPRLAQRVLAVGVGEGLDIAARRLASLPDAARLTVAAWYPGSFAPHFPGRTVKLADRDADGLWNWARAHFVVSYINQWQRQPNQEILAYFKGQPTFETVQLRGVDYAPIFPGPLARPDDIARLGQPPLDFGEAVRLRGVEMAPQEVPSGAEVIVTLYWEPMAPIAEEDLLITLILRDDDGHEWGRSHGPPVGGFLPPRMWQPGMLIRDVQRLRVPAGTPPGTYRLLIGWYSPSARRALEARRADGTPVGDTAEVASLRIAAGPTDLVPDDPSIVRADLTWGDVRLEGWSPIAGRYPEGASLPLSLYWRALRASPGPIRLRLYLRDEAGKTWRRNQVHPISPHYPPARWRAGELVLERWDALLPAGMPDGAYTMILAAEDEAGRPLGQATLGRIEVEARPHVFASPTPQHAVNARLGERIRLLGYDLDVPPRPGTTLRLTLYWRAEGEINAAYTVFVHVLDPNGAIITQVDRAPMGGRAPTTSWLPGEVIADPYELPLPNEAGPVSTLAVGLYEPRTGRRLPAVVDGIPAPDGRILLRSR